MRHKMTDNRFDEYLELIAQLIESTATTPKEAAKIVRQAKVKKKTKKESATKSRKDK